MLNADIGTTGGLRKNSAFRNRVVIPHDEDDSLHGLGGYHGSVHVSSTDTVYYSIGAYSETRADGKVNGIPVFDQAWKNVVTTFYHELNEARTERGNMTGPFDHDSLRVLDGAAACLGARGDQRRCRGAVATPGAASSRPASLRGWRSRAPPHQPAPPARARAPSPCTWRARAPFPARRAPHATGAGPASARSSRAGRDGATRGRADGSAAS